MDMAAIVLGLAAFGGMTLAFIRLNGAPRPPTWMALGHGVIAVIGLTLLIYSAVNTGIPGLAQVALGVLILAALGGAVMFLGFHVKERALPIPFVLGHGLIAITGYILLLVCIFRGQ